MNDKYIITFGEIMIRLAAENNYRLKQVLPGKLEATFAGAEANVAASICMLGGKCKYITALPNNILSDCCIATLNSLGVNTEFIIKTSRGRLGLYFLEIGANQRPSNVIYDRIDSSINLTNFDEYDWDHIFENGNWLHISGITPALSNNAADCAIKAVQKAKSKNIIVSCDLNFRNKLWSWNTNFTPKMLAQKTMDKIIPFVDIVIGNEEDAYDYFEIKAGESEIETGKLEIEKYPNVARKLKERYPNIRKIAFTLRQSISANYNKWGAMLYDAQIDKSFFSPLDSERYIPYEIKNIVDRVGGGDSFAAALIFALNSQNYSENQTALNFATAASCLAHSIRGDFNYVSEDEVLSLMTGTGSGRVKR